ncbi:hypothetical protein ACFW6E_46305 [Streptomyces olivaceoviridis]|uniref:hypothetical protein n=1 Tax=Streptomyces olivaceoviridis TaxID=1921 RepID=UPI0036CE84B8
MTEQLPALVECLDPLWGADHPDTVSRTFWPVIPEQCPRTATWCASASPMPGRTRTSCCCCPTPSAAGICW